MGWFISLTSSLHIKYKLWLQARVFLAFGFFTFKKLCIASVGHHTSSFRPWCRLGLSKPNQLDPCRNMAAVYLHSTSVHYLQYLSQCRSVLCDGEKQEHFIFGDITEAFCWIFDACPVNWSLLSNTLKRLLVCPSKQSFSEVDSWSFSLLKRLLDSQCEVQNTNKQNTAFPSPH